jgi:signal peptide peptidase SppA
MEELRPEALEGLQTSRLDTLVLVRERFFGEPLMLEPEKLGSILLGVGPQLGLDVDWAEFKAIRAEAYRTAPWKRAPMPAAASHAGEAGASDEDEATGRPYRMAKGGIALIPIMGSLVQRSGGMQALSGLRSYEAVAAEVGQAADDPAVKGILLHLDSPGGEVRGAYAAADAIEAAGKKKPLWALAEDIAYSAGYLLAAPAARIVLPRAGGVGSIGVVAVHLDKSEAAKASGLRYTVLRHGAFKGDGNPYEPLQGAAKERIEERLGKIYNLFVAHVAQHRGIEAKAIRAMESGLYIGADAVDAGLADGVGDLPATLALFRETLTTARAVVPTAVERKRAALVEPQKEQRMSESTGEEGSVTESNVGILSSTNNVVELDTARVEGAGEERERVEGLVDLCSIAERPDMLSSLISEGTKVAEASKRLVALRAERSTANQVVTAHAGGTSPKASPRVPDYDAAFAPLETLHAKSFEPRPFN